MKNLSKNKMTTQRMTYAALLTAVGIIIPLFSPVKIMLEPASFTLASHVAIFIAMFLSPYIACFVSICTTLGFLFGGFPPVVVLRAASQIIFALVGSIYLKKFPNVTTNSLSLRVFSFAVGIIHALCETLVVTWFYMGGNIGAGYYSHGYLYSVILLVGVGGLVHSMIDFEIAWMVTKPLYRSSQKGIFEGVGGLPASKKVPSAS